MDDNTDVKTIVNIIKDIVKGYYAVVYRDTNSYRVQKFVKDEFLSNFTVGNWSVESDSDLTRFLMCDESDPITTDSDILKTFNAYQVGDVVKIASMAVVCDWSIFELAFDEKQPNEVLEMVATKKY